MSDCDDVMCYNAFVLICMGCYSVIQLLQPVVHVRKKLRDLFRN